LAQFLNSQFLLVLEGNHTAPVHNSVKIKNSAMPFSDSSAPIEAALRN
jgi:hypothetical protein